MDADRCENIFFKTLEGNCLIGSNLQTQLRFRTRDLQIMSIALVGEPLEFTK